MRLRLLTICAVATFATVGFAKDAYLSIGGTVSNFSTDMRIFNPSTTKDIQVQAYLLPVGNLNNSGVQPKTITVPKRQMLVYDNVLTSLFNAGGLGAIRLKSDDDFVATQRIFATVSGDTLGQYVPGLDVSTAKKQGVLIQLKSNGGAGQHGTYRTNIGVVNPNSVTANVTWRLYDKNNQLVSTGTPIAMPPFAVITPTNMAGTFFFTPGTADISDAWVNFTSDQPIFAYGSCIDNGSTDPTFIPAAEDSGVLSTTPQTPTGKVFTITAVGSDMLGFSSSRFVVSPAISGLNVGDQVTFTISAQNAPHGFVLYDPDDKVIVPGFIMVQDAPAVQRTFTIPKQGTYSYVCFNTSCSVGHTNMVGTFIVGQATEPQPRY